jgi:hypothetical protein
MGVFLSQKTIEPLRHRDTEKENAKTFATDFTDYHGLNLKKSV